jgi:hypothetical protein
VKDRDEIAGAPERGQKERAGTSALPAPVLILQPVGDSRYPYQKYVVVQFQNCDCFLLGGKKVFNAKYAKDSRRAQRKAPDERKLHHYPKTRSDRRPGCPGECSSHWFSFLHSCA